MTYATFFLVHKACTNSYYGLTGGAIGTNLILAEQAAVNNAFATSLPSLFTTRDAAYSSMPKAFLNWALFDERMNYISGGVTQVPTVNPGDYKKALSASLPSTITKNGYLYIYVSNESPQDVFFDNVTIQHKKGPLLEETHYYPFGLTMAGISSKALGFGGVENRKKFNGGNELQSKEFSDGSGLETYDATFRMYDPKIGRFMQIDPLGELNENISPYSFVNNNPILLNDPLGLAGDTTIKGETIKRDNDLSEVTVVGCHPCKTPTQSSSSAGVAFAFFGVDRADKYYGMWEGNYDHLNYTTTKGELKPFPLEVRRMSKQAKMFKQRSNIVSKTALGLSIVANILTAVQVRNQYLEGGISNIDPVDATDLTLGTAGITASALSKFNLFPKTLGAISNVVGIGTIALTTYQNWMTAFQIMYNTNYLMPLLIVVTPTNSFRQRSTMLHQGVIDGIGEDLLNEGIQYLCPNFKIIITPFKKLIPNGRFVLQNLGGLHKKSKGAAQ